MPLNLLEKPHKGSWTVTSPNRYTMTSGKRWAFPRTWEVRDTPVQPRDPAFRREVLREYERRCAVCEFDVRLGDELIGVEAAHIKWHAAGGPDEVSNGLALCWLHHKAFDRGALGIAAAGEGFRVLVSSEVNGLSQPLNWFLDFHDKPLRPPRGSPTRSRTRVRELAPTRGLSQTGAGMMSLPRQASCGVFTTPQYLRHLPHPDHLYLP